MNDGPYMLYPGGWECPNGEGLLVFGDISRGFRVCCILDDPCRKHSESEGIPGLMAFVL